MLVAQGNFITEQAGADISSPADPSSWEPSHAGPAPAVLSSTLPQLLPPGPTALCLRPCPTATAGAAQLRRQDPLLVLSPGDGGSVLCQLCCKKPN